jgi:hypothetical protein
MKFVLSLIIIILSASNTCTQIKGIDLSTAINYHTGIVVVDSDQLICLDSGHYTFIYPQEGMSVNLFKQSNNKPKLNLISTVIYFGECYCCC